MVAVMEQEKPNGLALALRHFGGNQTQLSKAIGLSQQVISYRFRNGMDLPAESVLATEKATGISRHELRPDLYPVEDAA